MSNPDKRLPEVGSQWVSTRYLRDFGASKGINGHEETSKLFGHASDRIDWLERKLIEVQGQLIERNAELATARSATVPKGQYTAMAWGDRIADEQLDELLERTKDAKTVLLRIDQFRDLARQAKSSALSHVEAQVGTVAHGPRREEILAQAVAFRDKHPTMSEEFAIAAAQPSSTVAPTNSLPTYEECALRVSNSNYLGKRKAEGGGAARPLEQQCVGLNGTGSQPPRVRSIRRCSKGDAKC